MVGMKTHLSIAVAPLLAAERKVALCEPFPVKLAAKTCIDVIL